MDFSWRHTGGRRDRSPPGIRRRPRIPSRPRARAGRPRTASIPATEDPLVPGPLRVLELRSVRGTGGGPEKTILVGASRTDPRRVAVTVCYIRDRRDDVFALDQLARQLGVDYVEITERHSFDRAIWPALKQLVRDRSIDVVHAHEYKTDLLALLLARAEGISPLATAHGWTGHSWREKALYYPADRWLLARFPRVIAVSEQIRGRLLQAGAGSDHVVTVLNGIDADAFRRNPESVAPARASLNLHLSAKVIGSVGRLEPQKRFDVLMEAVALLRRSGTDLRLVLVGDGSRRAELVSLAARLNLTDACTFAGHRTDVSSVLHAFDVFVQSSDYEGTPNAVLEAMAVETPVVATTAGGTEELIEDGVHGLLVRPGDPRTLSDAIARALGDGAASARRAIAARHRIERELSLGHRMERVERVYAELAAIRGVGRRTAQALS